MFLGFLCGSAGKESARNTRDLGSIPGLGRSPREGKDYPLHYSGLEYSGHTESGLYGPWDHKESDTTERLSLSLMSSALAGEFFATSAPWEALGRKIRKQ